MPQLLTRAARAAFVGLVALLAACSSPSALPAAPPAADVSRTRALPAPTTTDLSEPHLPRGAVLPALTATVGGSGTGRLVSPAVACVLWTWGGDALPALVDGLSFRVDHAVVVPDTWAAMPDVCVTSAVPSCAGAVLTADAPTCSIGFVRSRTASPRAFVGMLGTLRCSTTTHRDCVPSARQVDAASDLSPSLDLEALARRGG